MKKNKQIQIFYLQKHRCKTSNNINYPLNLSQSIQTLICWEGSNLPANLLTTSKCNRILICNQSKSKILISLSPNKSRHRRQLQVKQVKSVSQFIIIRNFLPKPTKQTPLRDPLFSSSASLKIIQQLTISKQSQTPKTNNLL